MTPTETPGPDLMDDDAFDAASSLALNMHGLAVTTGHYLVAGLMPAAGEPGGLLMFDLMAGGPPLQLAWPAPWRLVPHDIDARSGTNRQSQHRPR